MAKNLFTQVFINFAARPAMLIFAQFLHFFSMHGRALATQPTRDLITKLPFKPVSSDFCTFGM